MKSRQLFQIPELSLCIWAFFLHFFWEVVQTYFYTLREAAFNTMLYGWLHCTLGDVLITIGSFWIVSLIASNRRWFLDLKGGGLKFIGFVVLGVIYTFFSEWLNVHIFRSWGYTESMPIIPWGRVGLMPLLQWLIVPPAVVLLVRHHLLLHR